MANILDSLERVKGREKCFLLLFCFSFSREDAKNVVKREHFPRQKRAPCLSNDRVSVLNVQKAILSRRGGSDTINLSLERAYREHSWKGTHRGRSRAKNTREINLDRARAPETGSFLAPVVHGDLAPQFDRQLTLVPSRGVCPWRAFIQSRF